MLAGQMRAGSLAHIIVIGGVGGRRGLSLTIYFKKFSLMVGMEKRGEGLSLTIYFRISA